jgi:hypothetical protein
MNNIPFRKLSDSERVDRSQLLTESYVPYLRERHPMGSVVAINLLTAEYVVGGASPITLYMYSDTFGKRAEANMWLEPIHGPNGRPREEAIAKVIEWFEQRKKSRRKH